MKGREDLEKRLFKSFSPASYFWAQFISSVAVYIEIPRIGRKKLDNDDVQSWMKASSNSSIATRRVTDKYQNQGATVLCLAGGGWK